MPRKSTSTKTTRKKAATKKAVRKQAGKPAKTSAKTVKSAKKTAGRSVTKPPKSVKRTASRKQAAAKDPKGPGTTGHQAAAVVETTPVEAKRRPTRREGRLSPREIEDFRGMLLEKRREILGDVSTLHNEALNKNRSDASGDLSSMPIHMADLGTDNYELEFTLGLIEGERAILKEIDEALERIKNDTFGFCLATGQPIGKARLRAKPWAKYSYEYTLAQERGQTGGK